MRANEFKSFRADAVVESPANLHIVKPPSTIKKAVKEAKKGKKAMKQAKKAVVSEKKEKRHHKSGHRRIRNSSGSSAQLLNDFFWFLPLTKSYMPNHPYCHLHFHFSLARFFCSLSSLRIFSYLWQPHQEG